MKSRLHSLTLHRLLAYVSGAVQLHELALITAANLPCILFFLFTNNSSWLQSGLISSSLFLVFYRLDWGCIQLLAHWAAILAGISLLYHSQTSAWLFATCCALLAACCIGITYRGQKLRTLGSWTLIPCLYIACELFSRPPTEMSGHMINAQHAAVLIGPVLLLMLRSVRRKKPFKSFLYGGSTNCGAPTAHAFAMAGGICIAVFIAAFWVRWSDLPNGQWVIWSAVSVSTGEINSMYQKLKIRAMSGIIGLTLGVLLIGMLPTAPFTTSLAAMLIPATLMIRHYPLAFASRCLLIAVAAGNLSQSESLAFSRLFNVLAGGVIGVISGYFMLKFVARDTD